MTATGNCKSLPPPPQLTKCSIARVLSCCLIFLITVVVLVGALVITLMLSEEFRRDHQRFKEEKRAAAGIAEICRGSGGRVISIQYGPELVPCVDAYEREDGDPLAKAWVHLWSRAWSWFSHIPGVALLVHGICDTQHEDSICRWLVMKTIDNSQSYLGAIALACIVLVALILLYVVGPRNEIRRYKAKRRAMEQQLQLTQRLRLEEILQATKHFTHSPRPAASSPSPLFFSHKKETEEEGFTIQDDEEEPKRTQRRNQNIKQD